MNVALPKELENVVKEQVKTGLYQDAGEVIRHVRERHDLVAR